MSRTTKRQIERNSRHSTQQYIPSDSIGFDFEPKLFSTGKLQSKVTVSGTIARTNKWDNRAKQLSKSVEQTNSSQSDNKKEKDEHQKM